MGNNVASNQGQNQSASASGGESQSDSTSHSSSTANSTSVRVTSVSNYQNRTPPLTSFPPYLPFWNHGGWGTIKAYFPNGPTANDQIYETTFDPCNPSDMRELRSVLRALPHKGVLEAVGGALNNVAVVLFGKPDTYFHGRGIEIADSIVRDRRPEHKCLLVFIDSNVDVNLLGEEGYAYVGKVSVEADPDRNWDQGYKAVVAETLLWDVDILLISGGMKGVTTGSNTTFPSAAGGYSQANYSLSLMGGKAKGITEGQGKAMLSGEAYRYAPHMIERRRIPAAIYERIRCRPQPPAANEQAPRRHGRSPSQPVVRNVPNRRRTGTIQVTRGAWASQPAFRERDSLRVCHAQVRVGEPLHSAEVLRRRTPRLRHTRRRRPSVWTPGPDGTMAATPVAPTAPAPARTGPATARVEPRQLAHSGPGITMSQELFDMAGFANDQEVGYVNIR